MLWRKRIKLLISKPSTMTLKYELTLLNGSCDMTGAGDFTEQ
jgi:hypothetical protein